MYIAHQLYSCAMDETQTPAEWRNYRKLSLAAAARLAGVTGKNPARTRQRWERGEREPTMAAIIAIERASQGAVTLGSWMRVRRRFQGGEEEIRRAAADS